MAALLEDARRRLDDAERGETLDAAMIAAAQRIEHHEIATYGTARSYAEALGDYDAVRLLQQTLDEEGHTDHVLTKLAERGINQAAGDDVLDESTRYRSRLRFMGARDLPDLSGREIHLHNHDGDHLGTLDGFIVDSQSGRFIYYVIDSRGWFAGRRYVVPVGQIDGDDEGTTLETALTRSELARYPEFSPSAFTAMDDRDAERYERRLHRVFVPESAPYDGRPVYENLPVFRTSSQWTTGVWMSESSGFAVTPPQGESDTAAVEPVEPPERETGVYERTAGQKVTRDAGRDPGSRSREPRRPRRDAGTSEPGSPTGDSTEAPDSERMIAREEPEQPPNDTGPRIERYRER